MALTFCIGFTTALIAYGIPAEEAPVAYTPPATTETRSKSVAPSSASAAIVTAQQPSIELTETGLYYVKNGTRTIISAAAAATPDIPEAHQAVHRPLVSPNGRYVFYCTETAATVVGCSPRVFDYDGFGIHPVTVAGTADSVDPTNLDVRWGDDGRLQLNQFVSANTAAPWKLQ